jgi:circadian clock protein KaiB
MKNSEYMEAVLETGYHANKKAEYMLRLFVTGATPNSVKAVSNIKRICETHLAGKYMLEIIDLYNQKELAEAEQLVAVPMLIKTFPLPVRKLVGDLSNNIKVLDALGLNT